MRRPPEAHEYFRLLAAASIDGEVTPTEMLELRTHLASCPTCRADERAMRSDNAWLASVEALRPPRPQVRGAVLRAAEGHSIGGLGWSLGRVAATFATVLVAVGALWWASSNAGLGPGAVATATTSADASPSGRPAGTTAPTQPLPPAQWSVPPGVPFARVDARFVGNSTGAAPEIIVTAIVIGGDKGAPQGYVDFVNPTGASWRGSVTRVSYGYSGEGYDVYVARIEGCVGGGVAPCELYALQFIDGRLRPDDQDEISLSFMTASRPEPDPWEFWFLRVSGDVLVDGPIPRPEPAESVAPPG
jgi:hypothetical protein